MNNYRPISVISIVAKAMEKLVYNQLYEYFIINDMLTTSQHGFRPNHSTVSAMLGITNKWFQNIDIGQLNGIAFRSTTSASSTPNQANVPVAGLVNVLKMDRSGLKMKDFPELDGPYT